MANYKYDPLNNNFTVWEASKNPVITIPDPIYDREMDISDFATGITEDGTPIMKPERSVVTIQNTQEYEPLLRYEMIQQVPETQYNPTRDYTVNPALSLNQNIAMQFFISKGLEPHQAAGIVGNLMLESGDRTLSKTTNLGDGGRSFGIGLWNGSRRKNLENFAKAKGTSASDLTTQLEFIWHEITDGDQISFKVLEGLKQASNVEQATTAFMKRYERPGVPNLQNRIKYAKSLLQ